MSLAVERLLVPATGRPAPPAGEQTDQAFSISVIFTSMAPTLEALKEAGALASNLGARIRLIVPQVVPYRLPLESPPVALRFTETRCREIAAQSVVATSAQIYLCRNALETLLSVLTPGAIVVLGGPKRRWGRPLRARGLPNRSWPSWFWPNRAERLAEQLRSAGFEVLFKETE